MKGSERRPEGDEGKVVRDLTAATLHPRTWTGTAIVLQFLFAPLFVGGFQFVLWFRENPWSPLMAYLILALWGLVVFLLLAWSKGTGTADLARKIILRSGWQIRDLGPQLFTGLAVIGGPLLVLYVIVRPGLRTGDFVGSVGQLAFIWLVAAPVETWLQWNWSMALPFGPVAGVVASIALHGERALDPVFLVSAGLLFSVFWILMFLRYVDWSGAQWFGPIAAWSGHATWNSLLVFAAFQLPTFAVAGVAVLFPVFLLVSVVVVVFIARRRRGA